MKEINLEEMFKIQKDFTKEMEYEINNVDIEKLSYPQQCSLTKDYGYAVIEEVVELIRDFEVKRHKRIKKKEFDKEIVLDEVVDVFKFWMNLLIILGYDIMDFKKKWLEKTKVVAERFQKEKI